MFFSNELSPSLSLSPIPHSLFILVHPFLFPSLPPYFTPHSHPLPFHILSLTFHQPSSVFLSALAIFLPASRFSLSFYLNIFVSPHLCLPYGPAASIYLFPSFLYLISGLLESLALSHGSLHLRFPFLFLCLSLTTFACLLFFSVIFCRLLNSVFLPPCLSNAPSFIFLRVWPTPTRTVSPSSV